MVWYLHHCFCRKTILTLVVSFWHFKSNGEVAKNNFRENCLTESHNTNLKLSHFCILSFGIGLYDFWVFLVSWSHCMGATLLVFFNYKLRCLKIVIHLNRIWNQEDNNRKWYAKNWGRGRLIEKTGRRVEEINTYEFFW